MTKAWYILFLQLFQGIGGAAIWVAATSQASVLAPPGLTSTFLGILSGIHYGISAGLGIIFGGIFYEKYGVRLVFSGYSIVLLRKRRKKKNKPLENDSTLTDETGKELIQRSLQQEKDNPASVLVIDSHT